MANLNKDNYEESELYKIRHSAAHILAEAVLELFPDTKVAIGPATKDGFYYDFDLGQDDNSKSKTFTPDDLKKIEKRVKKLLKQKKATFDKTDVSIEEALILFKDQPYKLELIKELSEGKTDENERQIIEPVQSVTVFKHRDFSDLCRGPHVDDTKQIYGNSIKILKSSGAYWRGDEKLQQLQRIYGTAWHNKEELNKFLYKIEEAEKRDHRKLGKKLELFHLDDSAPGMPYWLPKGLKVINTLIDFWRDEHEKRGYQEISAPLINNKKLWETSGHWAHYKDDMFIVPVDENNIFGVKPMNCPNAMIVYSLKNRSYRELPLRFSDCDVLHRNERSGTLHGLLRVQMFRQDDSHNFISEDQIGSEINQILDIADLFYSIFGLKYIPRLSTRPEDFMGEIESWNKAETALKNVLEERFGSENYLVLEGDGAFYGPKIDILMEDVLEREWQMGTIQLDFQLPGRFNLSYTDRDGESKVPIVIHRVIYGSLERFMGILIEHFAGAFPLWISPVQVVVIPITDSHVPYAKSIAEKLLSQRIRVEVDSRNERMNSKIRDNQLLKTPYMLIVGDKEEAENTISIRTRGGQNLGNIKVERFISSCIEQVAKRTLDLSDDFE